MISTQDLYEEIDRADAIIEKLLKGEKVADSEIKAAELKLASLNSKLLHNLRTNSVLIMKHLNIDTVKPKRDGRPIETKKG